MVFFSECDEVGANRSNAAIPVAEWCFAGEGSDGS
jgi:hypothetical protein